MHILILSDDSHGVQDATVNGLQTELKRRGYIVTPLGMNELSQLGKKLEKEGSDARKKFRIRRIFGKRYRLLNEILVPAFEHHLKDLKYDFLIATDISMGEIISKALLNSQQYVPPSILISTQYNDLPKKATMASDEYILFSQSACNHFLEYGIPAERIHFFDATKNTISSVCDFIEDELRQWDDLMRHFLGGEDMTNDGISKGQKI